MSSFISSFTIAGTGSGVGKTTIALALGRALQKRGLRVRPFKVGPDYIDPGFLKRSTGVECYNLDSWMTSESYMLDLFNRKSKGHDIAMIEGVMGLFDGPDVTSSFGSTAHISQKTNSPVVLVVHAKGAARSICATVKGFCEFDTETNVIGVIANYLGSAKHGVLIKEALESAGLPPLVGAICNGDLPQLGERHLGLVEANEYRDFDIIADEASTTIERCVDINAILKMTRCEVPEACAPADEKSICTIGIAWDQAFSFIYPDNIEAFKRHGITPVFFSPICDHTLPPVDALYFPGGYPELYARELSVNNSMLESIRQFSLSGKMIYGECGGLLYLSKQIDGHELVGLFNSSVVVHPKLKRLGYSSLLSDRLCPWGETTLRGHLFHYSSLEIEGEVATPFTLKRKGEVFREGICVDHTFASYFHAHWASNDQAIINFRNYILRCRE